MIQIRRWLRCPILFLSVLPFTIPQAAAQLTSNVLERALMIWTKDGQATGFTIDVDEKQYLITAKHVVAGLGSTSTISIGKFNSSGKLVAVPMLVKIYRCDDPIDIAVLIPPEQLTVTFPLEPTKKGLSYGQDVFFIGYPLGMYSRLNGFNSAYPFGFVKKGLYSGEQDDDDAHVTFLDGYNIFGFSGSPVVFSVGNSFDYKVIGVVSGFTPDYEPVFVRHLIKPEDIKPDDISRGRIVEENGKYYKLVEMPGKATAILNTGIVRSYGIEHAVDLIHKHPEGPTTRDDFQMTFAPDNLKPIPR